MRNFLVLIHRYIGLLLILFLVIVGLTGSMLAFYHELDRWLNPTILAVPIPKVSHQTQRYDLFTLREKVEQQQPHARIDWLNLNYEPGQSYRLFLIPRIDLETGNNFELPFNDLYFNPYTAEQIGARYWGEASLAKENIMPFLYRLHYSLALPENIAMFGVYVLGVAALFWFVDCFVGFYLTFPSRRKRAKHSDAQTDNYIQRTPNFWKRWKPVWQIKQSRFNYDLHRASGLWLWPMLLILAWSGVALNLKEVYQPVMSTVFNMRDMTVLPKLDVPIEAPALEWRAAHQIGQQYIHTAAMQYGFTIDREQSLYLDREHGVYHYRVKSERDLGKYGATIVILDANTGALHSLTMPDTDSAGDVINRWIIWLHTARVFGLSMQILICITGLIVTILSISGAVIWLKKRKTKKMLVTKVRVNKEMITKPSSL